ncbi:MAG: hypothetical protein QOD87_342 [Pseudonocardiales bacterium]|jgi:hypothetical protein|nr:hypothetical protein [Pseudonocardiales bacterium]
MSRLEEIAERDHWLCWLCDEPVDPTRSVNDSRGPSVDSLSSDNKSGKSARRKGGSADSGRGNADSGRGNSDAGERLAHRGCNTKKGAVKPVVPWPDRLFISDPAPLIGVAERLGRKGGREVVARCPSRPDAEQTAAWLVDRFSRLVPELAVTASVEPGGGQFMVALATPRL